MCGMMGMFMHLYIFVNIENTKCYYINYISSIYFIFMLLMCLFLNRNL